jgi:hypothetical protein
MEKEKNEKRTKKKALPEKESKVIFELLFYFFSKMPLLLFRGINTIFFSSFIFFELNLNY